MKLRVLILIFLASCINKTDKEVEICSDPAIPETQVKMLRDSVLVDSLITIIPIASRDTLRFLSVNFDDSTETIMQRGIFELKKVSAWTTPDTDIIDFWFTRYVAKTDSTKDFGLFFVFKKDRKAHERLRFRFNNKNEIIGVNNTPLLPKDFLPINTWTSDTIPRDE